MHDEWFSDEERVRKTVGLLSTPVIFLSNAKEVSFSPEKGSWLFAGILILKYLLNGFIIYVASNLS